MPDPQTKKKQVVDKKTLPNLFILICKGWMIVAVGALAMVRCDTLFPLLVSRLQNFTVWMFILIENLRVYHHGESEYVQLIPCPPH